MSGQDGCVYEYYVATHTRKLSKSVHQNMIKIHIICNVLITRSKNSNLAWSFIFMFCLWFAYDCVYVYVYAFIMLKLNIIIMYKAVVKV